MSNFINKPSEWTMEEDEFLIDFVKNHEMLFNAKHSEYRKTQMKMGLWKEVGDSLNRSGDNCSKRWAYIRDYYIKKRGKKPGTGSSGEASRRRSDLLSFLDVFGATKRSSLTNVEGEGVGSQILDSSHCEGSSLEEATEEECVVADVPVAGPSQEKDFSRQPPKKKRVLSSSDQRMQLLKEISERSRQKEQLDDADLFFLSMSRIVKKLPPYEQAALRLKISNAVGEAELKFLAGERRLSNDSPSGSPHSYVSYPKNIHYPISPMEVLSVQTHSDNNESHFLNM